MNLCSLSGVVKRRVIGEKSAFFQLEVTEKGKEKEYMSYISCKTFATSLIQNLAQYCVEDMFVLVKGRLNTNQYEKQKEGVSYTVYETYVLIEQLEYLGISDKKQKQTNYQPSFQNQNQNGYQQAPVQPPLQQQSQVQSQVYQQQPQSGYQQPQYYGNYQQPQPAAAVGNNVPPWQQ